MQNLFLHPCQQHKILTSVRMTVMLNLFQHLCQQQEIPIFIGMTLFSSNFSRSDTLPKKRLRFKNSVCFELSVVVTKTLAF